MTNILEVEGQSVRCKVYFNSRLEEIVSALEQTNGEMIHMLLKKMTVVIHISKWHQQSW